MFILSWLTFATRFGKMSNRDKGKGENMERMRTEVRKRFTGKLFVRLLSKHMSCSSLRTIIYVYVNVCVPVCLCVRVCVFVCSYMNWFVETGASIFSTLWRHSCL